MFDNEVIVSSDNSSRREKVLVAKRLTPMLNAVPRKDLLCFSDSWCFTLNITLQCLNHFKYVD
jgi:hypothetical protein